MTRVRRIPRFPFLLFLVAALLALTGCDTTVNNQGPQPFDGTGTISGQLVDKTTNDPLAGAAVTLKSAQEDDDSTPRTDTTGSDGQFYFENVPVNRASDSGTPSSQHVLDLDLSGVSGPYRNRYSAEVSLPYGGSEDGGSANNLTASVTIPVSRLNANIQGRVNDTEGAPLSGADVVLVAAPSPLLQCRRRSLRLHRRAGRHGHDRRRRHLCVQRCRSVDGRVPARHHGRNADRSRPEQQLLPHSSQ